MKKLSAAVHSFVMQAVPAETLAFFRIAISAFALVQCLVLLPDWMWIYGPAGLLPWEVSEPLSTNNFPALGNVAGLPAFTQVSPKTVLFIVTGVYILSLIGLLAGFKTRLTGMLAWLTHGILNTTGHMTAYGVETFIHISLFYCMVLPSGIRWSMDARRRTIETPQYLVTLSVRIIQLHLCIMYISCGIEKAGGTQWWDGEAIWIALQQDQFHTLNIDWMANLSWVPKILCWGTMLVETFYPLALLFKPARKPWLLGILSMHLFIGVFLGLQLFGALMMLLNIAAFGQLCFPSLYEQSFIKKIKSPLPVKQSPLLVSQ